MQNIFLWLLLYTLILALSQILLKVGLNNLGPLSFQSPGDIAHIAWAVLKDPPLLIGTFMMASSYFLWLAILSWFKLSLAYPLTAMGFVFVAVFSYFIIGEKLLFFNYFGIGLITVGVFILLYKP